MHKISILVGPNGYGKSFLRKILWQRVEEEINDGRNPANYVADASMERRTGMHSEFGGAGAFLRDVDWNPTSVQTISFANGLMKCEDRFLVFDEIELGMGEETQLGFAKYFNDHIDEVLDKNLGILIITHSRLIIQNIKHDEFFSLDGMSEEEWLNRIPEAIDIEQLNIDSNELFDAIQKRLKKH